MIPICLVTGFLGTGKTTFLKHLAAEGREKRWVYLVNEFSALDVDGAIVSADNPDVVSIPGGSIFCKCLVSEFIGQMRRLQALHGDAEGVVVEASGTADPRVIEDMLRETGLAAHFSLARIVTIVEPRSFLRLIHTLPNIRHQIEAADAVVVNKCDLYDEDALSETEKAIRDIKADAHIVRGIHADVELDVFRPGESRGALHGEYAECRDPRFSAFSLDCRPGTDADRLQRFIKDNEEGIYRVKGFIPASSGPVYFDYSKAGFSLEPAGPAKAYGLAWICAGGSADRIQREAREMFGFRGRSS